MEVTEKNKTYVGPGKQRSLGNNYRQQQFFSKISAIRII
jgi:hypothetical protein